MVLLFYKYYYLKNNFQKGLTTGWGFKVFLKLFSKFLYKVFVPVGIGHGC